MPKQFVKPDFPGALQLIGISTSARAYRLTSRINNTLKITLKKISSLPRQSAEADVRFQVFSYTDEMNRRTYCLIENKASGAYFIPERKQADFLFMLQGYCPIAEKNVILDKIKALDLVQVAFDIEVSQLRSKQNLIFE